MEGLNIEKKKLNTIKIYIFIKMICKIMISQKFIWDNTMISGKTQTASVLYRL